MLASSLRSFCSCFPRGCTRAARNWGGTPYRSTLSQNRRTAQMWIQALKACRALMPHCMLTVQGTDPGTCWLCGHPRQPVNQGEVSHARWWRCRSGKDRDVELEVYPAARRRSHIFRSGWRLCLRHAATRPCIA